MAIFLMSIKVSDNFKTFFFFFNGLPSHGLCSRSRAAVGVSAPTRNQDGPAIALPEINTNLLEIETSKLNLPKF